MSPQKASAKLVDFIHVDTFHRSAVGEYLLVKSGASLPKNEGIYALLAGDDIRYVGSANRVRSRLKTYLRRQKNGTSTRPVHKHLQQELARRDVEIYVRTFAERIVHVAGAPVDFVLGVESGLIATLSPLWNRRGKKGGVILETPTPEPVDEEP